MARLDGFSRPNSIGKNIRAGKIRQALSLTGQFPTVSYALVPACVKLAHFGLLEEITQN